MPFTITFTLRARSAWDDFSISTTRKGNYSGQRRQTKVCPNGKKCILKQNNQSVVRRENWISSLILKQQQKKIHFEEIFTHPSSAVMVEAHYMHIPYSNTINWLLYGKFGFQMQNTSIKLQSDQIEMWAIYVQTVGIHKMCCNLLYKYKPVH